ncbi:uncharacterized protein LOC144071681 isoform X2 [Stigmatopora argus]
MLIWGMPTGGLGASPPPGGAVRHLHQGRRVSDLGGRPVDAHLGNAYRWSGGFPPPPGGACDICIKDDESLILEEDLSMLIWGMPTGGLGASHPHQEEPCDICIKDDESDLGGRPVDAHLGNAYRWSGGFPPPPGGACDICIKDDESLILEEDLSMLIWGMPTGGLGASHPHQEEPATSASRMTSLILEEDLSMLIWGMPTGGLGASHPHQEEPCDICIKDDECLILEEDLSMLIWGMPTGGLGASHPHQEEPCDICIKDDEFPTLVEDLPLLIWGMPTCGLRAS